MIRFRVVKVYRANRDFRKAIPTFPISDPNIIKIMKTKIRFIVGLLETLDIIQIEPIKNIPLNTRAIANGINDGFT